MRLVSMNLRQVIIDIKKPTSRTRLLPMMMKLIGTFAVKSTLFSRFEWPSYAARSNAEWTSNKVMRKVYKSSITAHKWLIMPYKWQW